MKNSIEGMEDSDDSLNIDGGSLDSDDLALFEQ